MGKKSVIKTSLAPEALGTYSQGVEVQGFFYFSGQIGLDPETNLLKEGFEEQLDQTLKNIDALLESRNLTRSDIVKTTVFLSDLGHFKKVNEAYLRFFGKFYPARSCVEVSKLPKDALVEIEVIAARGGPLCL